MENKSDSNKNLKANHFDTSIVIDKAQIDDLNDILAIQKLAFRNEAELFNDYSITPLIQSIESIKDDFKSHLYLKAVSGNNIIGSVRANEKDKVCYIGRLFVHPDYQNRGIGKSLMLYIEELFKHCSMYSLFAAKRVSKNLHLYSRLGYRIVKEEIVNNNLTFTYFDKDII